MKQLVIAVNILHNKFKVFHGDIKTDNILIKGTSDRDKFLIKRYSEMEFFSKYSNAKKEFWLIKGKDIDKIDTMKKQDKLNIRRTVHKMITEQIIKEFHESGISNYSIPAKYIEEMNISLGDFGTHCSEDNHYDEQFGTRYYMAPEIILLGDCSYPVDIWALGCTYFELLTGTLLFDPIKDTKHSRDYYHLQLISDTCGELESSFLKKTERYKEFYDTKFRLVDYQPPENSRMSRKLQFLYDLNQFKAISSFLNWMLFPNPKKRIVINKVMDFFSKDF